MIAVDMSLLMNINYQETDYRSLYVVARLTLIADSCSIFRLIFTVCEVTNNCVNLDIFVSLRDR